MVHPDQCYDVRPIQQQKLQSEATRQRPGRAGASMLKLTLCYARYIFATLATVGFGFDRN